VAAALGIQPGKFAEEHHAMKGKRGELHKLPADLVIRYAMADAILAYLIYEKQNALVQDEAKLEPGRLGMPGGALLCPDGCTRGETQYRLCSPTRS